MRGQNERPAIQSPALPIDRGHERGSGADHGPGRLRSFPAPLRTISRDSATYLSTRRLQVPHARGGAGGSNAPRGWRVRPYPRSAPLTRAHDRRGRTAGRPPCPCHTAAVVPDDLPTAAGQDVPAERDVEPVGPRRTPVRQQRRHRRSAVAERTMSRRAAVMAAPSQVGACRSAAAATGSADAHPRAAGRSGPCERPS